MGGGVGEVGGDPPAHLVERRFGGVEEAAQDVERLVVPTGADGRDGAYLLDAVEEEADPADVEVVLGGPGEGQGEVVLTPQGGQHRQVGGGGGGPEGLAGLVRERGGLLALGLGTVPLADPDPAPAPGAERAGQEGETALRAAGVGRGAHVGRRGVEVAEDEGGAAEVAHHVGVGAVGGQRGHPGHHPGAVYLRQGVGQDRQETGVVGGQVEGVDGAGDRLTQVRSQVAPPAA